MRALEGVGGRRKPANCLVSCVYHGQEDKDGRGGKKIKRLSISAPRVSRSTGYAFGKRGGRLISQARRRDVAAGPGGR